MLAPAVEPARHLRQAHACLDHAHPQVEVLRPADLAPAADRIERLAPDQRRPVRQRTVDVDIARHRLVLEQRVVPGAPAAHARADLAGREQAHAAAAHARVGSLGQVRQLELEAAAVGEVVGVLAREERTRREPARGLEGGRQPARLRAHEADTRVARGGLRDALGRVVARAVVDGNDLEVGDSLAQDGRKGGVDPRPGVAGGQEHGDERPAWLIRHDKDRRMVTTARLTLQSLDRRLRGEDDKGRSLLLDTGADAVAPRRWSRSARARRLLRHGRDRDPAQGGNA
jgi:hypothetical protein